MAKCSRCGKKFDVDTVKIELDEIFEEEDLYEFMFPDYDVCGDCAEEDINSNGLPCGDENQYFIARDHGELDELGWDKKKRDKFKEWWG